MGIFTATSRKRETYKVEIAQSLLWECALGIAAVTNGRLLDTMETSKAEWGKLRNRLSDQLNDQLDLVQQNNTWKTLLQLLHQGDFHRLEDFIEYIDRMDGRSLKFVAIPFLGDDLQDKRRKASEGHNEAIEHLKEVTRDNPFFPNYIEYIANEDTGELKQHLTEVMEKWYKEVVEPQADKLEGILERDATAKVKNKTAMHPESFVEWATGGISYLPEPRVEKVLLIPHVTYRPWNVEADIEGSKVFYYPVSNESIHPGDAYTPSASLVQKHKALGDEVRLRIIKLLAEQDQSLQDLHGQLDAGKSTVHHHLKILRSCRLVEVDKGVYTLKRQALESLAGELKDYIGW
ncbi:ArsR/SmtB family transcription factor [Thalassobacillus hwangdonensis]|uniref:ArsR/SmtB family transcription factor n=1 Tax=Thalassobacillus hwangdonensis TaxID=546108 RepID=A0ABW3L1L7_9BACI